MWREFGCDYRLDMAILQVEAVEEIQHLRGLRHRLADVAQVVGELL
jgi:hypothetical protein